MSAARAWAEPTAPHPLSDPALPRDGHADPIDRVVALFSGAAAASPAPASPAAEDDWSTSLTAVRGAAARVRALQASARDSVREAQSSVRAAETALRAAEERARHAEALLQAALTRAKRAEAQARASDERAERAEAQRAEARAWLRRMHECMVNEFGALSGAADQP
ncbi:MAG: hypothetical protein PGN33_15565 [Methylobacterium radiotolerans]